MAMTYPSRFCLALLGFAFVGGCADEPFDFGQPRSCAATDQNEWVYSLFQDVYLWNGDLPEVDPSSYGSPAELIDALRVGPDRWSRVADQAQTEALYKEGEVIGFGFRWTQTGPSEYSISQVYSQSPADQAGLVRGDRIIAIDGVSVVERDEQDLWADVWGPREVGYPVDVDVRTGDELRSVHLVKDWHKVDIVPVAEIVATEHGPIGYVLFTSFIGDANDQLDAAFAKFVEADVRNLVIDMRYNGGGLVSVARHLVDLVLGARFDKEVGYRVRYNDNLSDANSSARINKVEFSLPNLERIGFITTGSTASASELVINSIAAHVDVAVVGSASAGKPVGSNTWDFCDQTVSPITFKLVNAEDYGDYFDGLPVQCAAYDDVRHPLGDPQEAALRSIATLLASGTCLVEAEPQGDFDPGRRQPAERSQPDGLDLVLGFK
jgi:hypothetical protein